MPDRVRDVEQTGRDVLMAFLQTELDQAFTADTGDDEHVFVLGEWPSPEATLPKKALTILPAGNPEVERFQEDEGVELLSQVNNVGTYRYAVKAIRQPLQLDIWATSDAARSEMRYHLDNILHKPGDAKDGPVRDGPLLAMTAPHAGWADFTFDPAAPSDTPSTVRQREWRSTYRGHMDVVLHVTASSPILARIIVRQFFERGGEMAHQFVPGQEHVISPVE